ncbi:MAG TPA: nuclear transport factor 2 family protein [Steroidobacteraceae bacterium]|nr:nuclear transport factor 2 family protein [Steroidobacteraceae bacterium]
MSSLYDQGVYSMKTPKKQLFGLAVLLVAAGIRLAVADPAAEVAAIHAVDDVWVKAFNTRDADTMAAQYDEHSVLLPPGAPPVRGRSAIRVFFANMMPEAASHGLEFTLGAKPAGGVRGDLGWSSGTYTLKDKTGHVIETGKYLSVSRKKDGKWIYVRDTWNSDGAPAAKESAPPPKK